MSKENSYNWRLQKFTDSKWETICTAPTGDNAKTKARNHAIGSGQVQHFRILAPNETVWLHGISEMYARGLRMIWTKPETCKKCQTEPK